MAADLLTNADVEVVVHCGDIGSIAVLDQLHDSFSPLEIPVFAVPGNVDHDEPEILNYRRGTVSVMAQLGKLTIDGKRIAIAHGDHSKALMDAVGSGDFAYVFTGHTHKFTDRVVLNTRVINPGAVHRAAAPSCAVLDAASGELNKLLLPVAST
jgi:putative phosphoesterase